MALYRVFGVRKEIEYADIEATSIEEAEQLADDNYSDQKWTLEENFIEWTILDETELLNELTNP